jgi:hypothetical protein
VDDHLRPAARVPGRLGEHGLDGISLLPAPPQSRRQSPSGEELAEAAVGELEGHLGGVARVLFEQAGGVDQLTQGLPRVRVCLGRESAFDFLPKEARAWATRKAAGSV